MKLLSCRETAVAFGKAHPDPSLLSDSDIMKLVERERVIGMLAMASSLGRDLPGRVPGIRTDMMDIAEVLDTSPRVIDEMLKEHDLV